MYGAVISIDDGQPYETYVDILSVCKYYKLQPVSIDMTEVKGQVKHIFIQFKSKQDLELFDLGMTGLNE